MLYTNGASKNRYFCIFSPRKIPFPFPVLLLAAVNGNRAGIRLTIIWIFRKILETDRIKTRKLFRNFQNFPDFLHCSPSIKGISGTIVPYRSHNLLFWKIQIGSRIVPVWIFTILLPIALIQSVSNITPTHPRSVAVNHAGLWIRRHQFESGRGYPEIFLK